MKSGFFLQCHIHRWIWAVLVNNCRITILNTWFFDGKLQRYKVCLDFFVSSKVLSSIQSRMLPIWIMHSGNIECISNASHCAWCWKYSGDSGHLIECGVWWSDMFNKLSLKWMCVCMSWCTCGWKIQYVVRK